MSDTNINEAKKERKSIVDRFTEWSLNWVPDSMVFVLSLTIIIFVLAWFFTDHGPIELIDDYANGFWILLSFAMQLSLMMITGFVIAESDFIKKYIIKLVELPKTANATIFMYCFMAGFMSWCHWAMGMMFGIVMAREIAIRKRGIGLHYPLLVAMVYGTSNIMANGPSQSAPLIAATHGNFLEETIGHIVPISETALSPFLLTIMLIQFIAIPCVFILLKPKKEKVVEIDDLTWNELSASQIKIEKSSKEEIKKLRPAERWERSRVFTTLVALIILVWVVKYVIAYGISRLDINFLNYTFLALALLLQKTPGNFVNAVKRAVGTTSGVIIQFPLYAGIFGIIKFSGFAHVLVEMFQNISTPGTYSWIIMLYTTIMDFFVPSGGSKFAIEAPFIIPAGTEYGISAAHIINSYSTGAQMANNIQPFWALPILAVFKAKFQQILPYTFVIFLMSFIVGSVAFLVFPY